MQGHLGDGDDAGGGGGDGFAGGGGEGGLQEGLVCFAAGRMPFADEAAGPYGPGRAGRRRGRAGSRTAYAGIGRVR